MKTLVIFLLTLISLSAFAAEPFEKYFGKYQIKTCTADQDGYPTTSAVCDYNYVAVGKDSSGVVRITLSTKDGSSVSMPIEIFDRASDQFQDKATFSVYGDYQVWTHTLSYSGNLEQEIKIQSYYFNVGSDSLPVFGMSTFTKGRHGQSKGFIKTTLVPE